MLAAETLAATVAADPMQQLEELLVAPRDSLDGYDRGKYPHWRDQGDSCDTRDAILKRDGEGVEVGSDCYPTAGTWTSHHPASPRHRRPYLSAQTCRGQEPQGSVALLETVPLQRRLPLARPRCLTPHDGGGPGRHSGVYNAQRG